jgi:hypothetical protein
MIHCRTGVEPITAADSDEVDVTGKWCIFLGGMDRSILSHHFPVTSTSSESAAVMGSTPVIFLRPDSRLRDDSNLVVS